jgi:hypothetical protein
MIRREGTAGALTNRLSCSTSYPRNRLSTWETPAFGIPTSNDLVYVPENDWDSQTAVSDEPWEATYSGADTFEATF